MKKISIVIGLYNSANTITQVIREIEAELAKLVDYDYEVILVNDFSPDNVLDIAKGLAKKNRKIKIIDLAKNSGQTNAVITGYRFATGDYIVEMDDDFQMPAYEIGRMVKELEEKNFDVVFAKYREKKEGRLRLAGSRINAKMAELMIKKPKNVVINSFFVMRSFVKDSILQYQNNFPYLYGIIFATTARIGNVEVDHRERTNGRSNYTFKSLFSLWMSGLLNFSILPLRLASAVGVMITIISFIIAVILIVKRLMNPTGVLGWTSIVVAIIFFSGILLFGMGIVGEYLGRLYISLSGIQRNYIRECINVEQNSFNDRENNQKEEL